MSFDWENTSESPARWRAGGGLRLPWKYSLWIPPVVLVLIYLSLTRGYESRHITFAHISSTSSGLTLGNGTVWAFEGQTITVDYDVSEIRRGHLRIFIMQNDPFTAKVVQQHRVRTTGKGQTQWKVPKTGFYRVDCDGSPDGNGYDVTYTASWKAT